MLKGYKCGFCKRGGIKLWHPEGKMDPLICASCAEDRQSKVFCNEYIWSKNKRIGHKTGKKIPLKRWRVNEAGEVPSYAGLNAFGKPFSYTTTLICDFGKEHNVSFVPADEQIAWSQLPTG